MDRVFAYWCRGRAFILCYSLLLFLAGRLAFAQNVTTYSYNNAISGINAQEVMLTPANVNVATFGQIFDVPIDGQAYAQPLYLSHVTIANKGIHNVVFIATCHDTVYAFDADAGGDPLWVTSFISPAAGPGISTVPQPDVLSGDIQPEIGIVGTPVIDATTGTLYVVAKTKETGRGDHHVHYVQKLHALDVGTGAEKFGGPAVIGDVTCDDPHRHDPSAFDYNLAANPQTPGVKGTSGNAINGTVYFNALRANQRASLTLSKGVIYIPWSSHGDNGPYHGWVIGFDAKTLMPISNSIFCITPDGEEGGMWQAGSGMAVDGAGNLYFSTGNGDFNGNTAGRNWSQSFMKFVTSFGLSTAQSSPGPGQTFDYFAPHDEKSLSDADVDMGSGGLILVDLPSGPAAQVVIGTGKVGYYYVMNRDDMGKFDPKTDHLVQTIDKPEGHEVMATPLFFNNTFFSYRNDEPLRARAFRDGKFEEAYNRTTISFNSRGGGPIVSANGVKDGVVWMLRNGQPGSLLAFSADALADPKTGVQVPPLYSEDLPDGGVKFTHPIVVNGKVYAICATRTDNFVSSAHLCAFGLLPKSGSAEKPLAPTLLKASSNSPEEIDLDWANHDPNVAGFIVERRRSESDSFFQVGTAGGRNLNFHDKTVSGATSYQYHVVAVNDRGRSDFSDLVTIKSYNYVSEKGLVAAWSFDEGDGISTLDITGRAHTGKLKGEVSWSQGVHHSNGLEFHGTGNAVSHVEVEDRADLDFAALQSFSIVAWARPSSLPGHWAAILAKSREAPAGWYGIYISPDNHWTFRNADETKNVSGGTVVPNVWHQLIAVQDGAHLTRTLYVDGVQVASGSCQPADASGPLWIGQGNADEEGFAGSLDEIRIYDRPLDPGEVKKMAEPDFKVGNVQVLPTAH